MSEITETEIKSMSKEQNYIKGYTDGKNDILDKIYVDIQRLRGCSCIWTDLVIDDVEDILDKYGK